MIILEFRLTIEIKYEHTWYTYESNNKLRNCKQEEPHCESTNNNNVDEHDEIVAMESIDIAKIDSIHEHDDIMNIDSKHEHDGIVNIESKHEQWWHCEHWQQA